MAEEKPDKDQSAQALRNQAEALLSQARSQLADVQRALGAVVGDSALQARLSAVAAQMSGAAGELAQALSGPNFTLRPADLMALEGMVHSSEAATLITEASARAGASAAQMQALAAASAATRQEVQNLSRDLYERRIFNPYLHFSSAEDDAAYHAREAERQRLIAEDLARHTPEGDLKAAVREAGQMADAHTHGAGASPDFQPRWQHLVETIRQQREAMRAAGQSTESADRLLRDQLRQSLQGVPPAEVDRILAANDPLQATTAYFHSHHGSDLKAAAELPHRPSDATEPATPSKATRDAVAAAAIALQAGTDMSAAGLVMDDAPSVSATGHGLSDQAKLPVVPSVPVRS